MLRQESREVLRHSDSYTRLEHLIGLAWTMDMGDWLGVFGELWSGCENIGAHADELLEETPFGDLADDPGAWREFMMTQAERDYLQALPEVVTVYRGCYVNNKRGLSWSLDVKVAESFPALWRYRQPGQALLLRAEVDQHEIMAVKLDREETEVIALRPKIRSIRHLSTAS